MIKCTDIFLQWHTMQGWVGCDTPPLQSLIVKTDFMLEKQDLPENRLELGNCQ